MITDTTPTQTNNFLIMKNELPYSCRYYSIYFIASSVIILMLVAGFNYLVDPYRIYDTPVIDGFSNVKLTTGDRVYKTVKLAHQPMDAAILGTSRAGALRPDHPVFSNKKTVNLAIAAQPYVETKMVIDLLDPKKTRQIIFGMDFFVANAALIIPSDFTTENYSAFRKYTLLISISTIRDSYKAFKLSLDTLHRSFFDEIVSKWENKTKSKSIEKNMPQASGNQQIVLTISRNHHDFIESEKAYLLFAYRPSPGCVFEFESNADSPLKNFQAILFRAYHEDIDLRLFISPSHARQWETIAADGLWDKWEEWKRRLIKINEKEAVIAGKPPFPIWDFSGYNSVTTEALPALNDGQTVMKNYTDSSHYTPYVGDLVLSRLFDYHTSELKIPSDFGVLITSNNIDSHLAQIRTEREKYQNTHFEDIAEIRGLAEEVTKDKSCKNKSES